MSLRNIILAAFALATAVTAQSLPTSASADVPFQVRYAVNLTASGYDAYINIANDGAQGAAQFGTSLTGQANTGSICANVYAFDQAEEIVACCSCQITPDETVGLSLARDILAHSLTTVAVGSVTIKLVASAPGGNGSCTQSAATLGTSQLVNGLLVWGTAAHRQYIGATTFFDAETQFLPAQLSASEQLSLATKCSFIVGNGSGPGICASCETNALGAVKI